MSAFETILIVRQCWRQSVALWVPAWIVALSQAAPLPSLPLSESSIPCSPSDASSWWPASDRVRIAFVWSALSLLAAFAAGAWPLGPAVQSPTVWDSKMAPHVFYRTFYAPQSPVQAIALANVVAAVTYLVWLAVLRPLADAKSCRTALHHLLWSSYWNRAAFLVFLVADVALPLLQTQGDLAAVAFLWGLCMDLALIELTTILWDVYERSRSGTGTADTAENLSVQLLRFRFAALQCGAIAVALGSFAIAMQYTGHIHGTAHYSWRFVEYSVYSLVVPSVVVLRAAGLVVRVTLAEAGSDTAIRDAAETFCVSALLFLSATDRSNKDSSMLVGLFVIHSIVHALLSFRTITKSCQLWRKLQRSLVPATALQLRTGAECGVCAQMLCDDGSAKVVPHCGHAFHWDCLWPWVKRGNDSCPLCRGAILAVALPALARRAAVVAGDVV